MENTKGMVIEIKAQKVVLLTPDGQFIEVPRPTREIRCGQEIGYSLPQKRRFFMPAAVMAAAAAVLILFIFISDFPGFTPFKEDPAYGYIAMDINPSVELAFNSELEITEVRGINPEGGMLLEGLKPGDNLFTSLEYLLQRAVELSYLTPDHAQNFLMLTLVNPHGFSVSEDQLENLAQEKLSAENIPGFVGVYEIGLDVREKALGQKISLNRYLLQEIFNDKGEAALQITDYMPLRDIIEEAGGTLPGQFNPVEKSPERVKPDPSTPSVDLPGEKPPVDEVPPEMEEENDQEAPPPPVPEIKPDEDAEDIPPVDIPGRVRD